MCIEPVKLCFRQAPSGAIPANSPSLGRSLRHFRLANISVRGDGNLRHLSIGFFSFSGHHFVFSSYNPDEWIMQKNSDGI